LDGLIEANWIKLNWKLAQPLKIGPHITKCQTKHWSMVTPLNLLLTHNAKLIKLYFILFYYFERGEARRGNDPTNPPYIPFLKSLN
jgi:hypothetical protein